MLTIALKCDIIEFTGPHLDCDYTPTKYPEIMGLLSHLCDALEETAAVRFEVIAFSDDPWPVDVWCDLAAILKQIPKVLEAVRSPETTEFVLSFYEQGIDRDLLFTRGPSNQLTVGYRTPLEWNPIRSVEHIDATALETQLVALVKNFAQASHIVCPVAVNSQTFRAWLSGMSIPYPPADDEVEK